jgi:hypothetical protein
MSRAKKPEMLGDAPIQPEVHQMMNDLGRALDMMLNHDLPKDKKEWGFVLLMFPFEAGGRCNYISNARREDVVIMLKEQIKRFEGQPDVSGHA